jgi:hypothetical protein
VDCHGINKIQGKPFTVSELTESIEKELPAEKAAVRQTSKAG